MRAVILLAMSAAATVGVALALGTGIGAQTVDGLDLKAVRERALIDPEAAALFEAQVARRGERFKAEAADLASQAKAGQLRLGPHQARRPTGEVFDFDAMLSSASVSSDSKEDDLPRLIAFASLSMPDAALRQMIADVSRAGGVVVFRGFPANSAKQFTAGLAKLLPQGSVRANVGIDPRLFRAFDVQAVPTYVLTTGGFDLCDGFDCRTAVPPHDRVAGNVTLDYVLATLAGGAGPAAGAARIYADRLGALP
jgi:conjugal transfer pilus assembly protein TrbC